MIFQARKKKGEIKISRKKKGCLVFVILLLLFLLSFFWPHPTAQRPTLTEVSLEPVKIQNIPIEVTTLGNIVSPEAVMLKAEAAGVIHSVFFKSGQAVKKGDLLIQLEDASQRAAYQNAEAALFQAKSEYDRYMTLNQQDPAILSGLQIDQEKAAYQEARANLAIQKEVLAKMKVRAPFSGNLGSTNLSVGSYVNIGDPLIALVNLQDLMVVYALPESDYAQVLPGQVVHLSAETHPETVFLARVTYRSPLIDASSHAFNVRAKLLNPEGLSPGMLMHVTHILQAQNPVLAVPTASLISGISGFSVYEVKDGKVIEQPVGVGGVMGGQTEIKSGLKEGDFIITHGLSKVKPGQGVEVSAS